ncbi:MAG: ubiquinol-cytochrome C chaperone family protein [Pseudomonadota bacterium]
MFGLFQRQNEWKQTASEIYEKIVAKARHPIFYRDLSVPDTVEGRFEMIIVHLFILLQDWTVRFGKDDKLSKAIIETFFSDIEHSLREMGIGDLTVPKRMQKLADAFYGRVYAYKDALEPNDDDQKLVQALLRNLYVLEDKTHIISEDVRISAAKIAQYIRHSLSAFSKQEENDLSSGQFDFANPEDIIKI